MALLINRVRMPVFPTVKDAEETQRKGEPSPAPGARGLSTVVVDCGVGTAVQRIFLCSLVGGVGSFFPVSGS